MAEAGHSQMDLHWGAGDLLPTQTAESDVDMVMLPHSLPTITKRTGLIKCQV